VGFHYLGVAAFHTRTVAAATGCPWGSVSWPVTLPVGAANAMIGAKSKAARTCIKAVPRGAGSSPSDTKSAESRLMDPDTDVGQPILAAGWKARLQARLPAPRGCD